MTRRGSVTGSCLLCTPPHSTMPIPSLGSKRCPGWAQASASCGSTTSLTSAAVPTGRLWPRTRPESQAAKNRLAHAWGRRGSTSGTRTSRGPLPQLPPCSSVTIPNGQTLLTRLETKPGKGTALTILAHHLARAVYDMLKRHTAVDMDNFLRTSRSRAGEPGAARDPHGMSRQSARSKPCAAASVTAQVCIGRLSRRPGPCLAARAGSGLDDESRQRWRCAAPPPNLALTGDRDRSAMLWQRTG
jgi:hypothetical protein